MSEICKITIKGASGYGPIDEAYNDKLTICAESIRYEYTPMVENENNVSRKWSYKTTSPIFQKVFREASLAVEKILNWSDEPFCTDIGVTTFTVTYIDKTKRERDFILPGDNFKQCFAIIKQMIPGCEYMPAVLLTSEDYAEE